MNRSKSDLNIIKKNLEFLWNNPYSSFYKDKYKKEGIKSVKKIDSFEDFEKLPFLTRRELIDAGPYKFFFWPEEKINEVGFSSGTTDKNLPLMLFQRKASKNYLKTRYGKVRELKVKSHMMLYSTFSGQQRFRSWNEFQRDKTRLAWGDINNLETSAKIAARIKIDAIQTNPTVLYYFIPHLQKEYDLSRIKLVMIGGEFCSEEKAALLKSFFKNAHFEFTYGGMETRGKGVRCEFLAKKSPRFFHPLSRFYYFEIVESNGQDELVMTTTRNEGTMLVRYKTGDAVRIYEEKCPCGEKTMMEVYGRLGHDAVKIQGAFIYSDLISKAIAPFMKYLSSPEWKLHVFEDKKGKTIKPRLKLLLTVDRKTMKNEKIKHLIEEGVSRNLFVSTKQTLFDLVEKGIFMPLEIEFVEEFPLELKRKLIISHLE